MNVEPLLEAVAADRWCRVGWMAVRSRHTRRLRKPDYSLGVAPRPPLDRVGAGVDGDRARSPWLDGPLHRVLDRFVRFDNGRLDPRPGRAPARHAQKAMSGPPGPIKSNPQHELCPSPSLGFITIYIEQHFTIVSRHSPARCRAGRPATPSLRSSPAPLICHRTCSSPAAWRPRPPCRSSAPPSGRTWPPPRSTCRAARAAAAPCTRASRRRPAARPPAPARWGRPARSYVVLCGI